MAVRGTDGDAPWAEEIRGAQEAVGWTYGAKRMAAHLKAEGLVCNHKKVGRIMRERGLNARIRRRKRPKGYYRAMEGSHTQAGDEDLLGRDFSADRPGQRLVTDVTCVPCSDGWLYVSPVLDLYDGKVLSWSAGYTNDASLVGRMMGGLRKASLRAGGILHSDRGCLYRSGRYLLALGRLGLRRSVSAPGCPYDNARMENFFGLMKSELDLHQGGGNTRLSRRRVKALVKRYMSWYNEQRIQRKLGYRSPAQYRLDEAGNF